MVEKIAYQVLAVYRCNICKEDHQSGLALPDLLPDPGARLAEMADIKIRVYNNIKIAFTNSHAPTDKFNPKRLTITETDDKGKSRKVKITDIEELSKGGMTEIEKIETKKGSSPEPLEKAVNHKETSSAQLTLVADESPIEEEEIPFKETGTMPGMSFKEIRIKVVTRIEELIKANKNCREAMEKLRIQFKETKEEIVRLQSLIKAIDQPKGKKNGRKKPKPKSK